MFAPVRRRGCHSSGDVIIAVNGTNRVRRGGPGRATAAVTITGRSRSVAAAGDDDGGGRMKTPSRRHRSASLRQRVGLGRSATRLLRNAAFPRQPADLLRAALDRRPERAHTSRRRGRRIPSPRPERAASWKSTRGERAGKPAMDSAPTGACVLPPAEEHCGWKERIRSRRETSTKLAGGLAGPRSKAGGTGQHDTDRRPGGRPQDTFIGARRVDHDRRDALLLLQRRDDDAPEALPKPGTELTRCPLARRAFAFTASEGQAGPSSIMKTRSPHRARRPPRRASVLEPPFGDEERCFASV